MCDHRQDLPGIRTLREFGPGDLLVEFDNERGTPYRVRLHDRPERPRLLLIAHP